MAREREPGRILLKPGENVRLADCKIDGELTVYALDGGGAEVSVSEFEAKLVLTNGEVAVAGRAGRSVDECLEWVESLNASVADLRRAAIGAAPEANKELNELADAKLAELVERRRALREAIKREQGVPLEKLVAFGVEIVKSVETHLELNGPLGDWERELIVSEVLRDANLIERDDG